MTDRERVKLLAMGHYFQQKHPQATFTPEDCIVFAEGAVYAYELINNQVAEAIDRVVSPDTQRAYTEAHDEMRVI
jgi:hypothetical protein